ncbi:uncharacterized protein LOC126676465 [Mercurialis annua]|uniref:uncharacterized protein LOC126676465 n=1 Tax=Mercurialis annua TaxID=3986 RepID=UPI0021600C2A|nr:uncharacterized protein LOC126676465 [Mercurialis annua]
MEDRQLSQPFLSVSVATSASATATTTSSTSSSTFNIFLRLLTITSIGIISLWANHEASKSFDITIINHIGDETPAGKRFNLLYISNDKAIRIIQSASSIVENILYPNSNFPKKKVSRVTLRLVSSNQTEPVKILTKTTTLDEFEIDVSPPSSTLTENFKNFDSEFTWMVFQGMARIWIWSNSKSVAPSWVIDGLAEYMEKFAELGHFCLGSNKDEPKNVAEIFDYCEKIQKGFIQRLNQGLKDGWWHDFTVENGIGLTPSKNICDSFGNSAKGFSS